MDERPVVKFWMMEDSVTRPKGQELNFLYVLAQAADLFSIELMKKWPVSRSGSTPSMGMGRHETRPPALPLRPADAGPSVDSSRLFGSRHVRDWSCAVSEWMPIESAPKDGSLVLAHWGGGVIAGHKIPSQYGVAAWRERIDWHDPYTNEEFGEPNYWMPLPEPPK